MFDRLFRKPWLLAAWCVLSVPAQAAGAETHGVQADVARPAVEVAAPKPASADRGDAMAPAKPVKSPWPTSNGNASTPVALANVPTGSLEQMPAAVPPAPPAKPVVCSKKQKRRKACKRTKS